MTQPTPLTPPNCDLRDFRRMFIDIPRLRGSEFDATPDDAAWRAGFNLWISSWHSIPAGSLDNNETTLCKAAGLGRDLRTWRSVHDAAMHGWILCLDGRWYHATVAEMVLEAWLGKLAQQLSSGAGNAKRWHTTFDPVPIEGEIAEAVTLLSALNPDSKAVPKASRKIANSSRSDPDGKEINPDGTENSSRRDEKSVPSGSLERGIGKERGIGILSTSSVAASRQPPDDSPVFLKIPTNRFETEGENVPVTERFIQEFQDLYPAVDVRAELRLACAWCVANKDLRKTKKGMSRFLNGWLSRQQNKGVSHGTENRNSQHQPPNRSFGSTLSGVVRARNSGGLFDSRGPETVGSSRADDPPGDHGEIRRIGRPPDAA